MTLQTLNGGQHVLTDREIKRIHRMKSEGPIMRVFFQGLKWNPKKKSRDQKGYSL